MLGAMRRRMLMASVLLAVLPSPALAAAPGSDVYLLGGEQAVAVKRPGATIATAVAALLAGPTRAERAKGLTTALLPATHVLGVAYDRQTRVATVDLSQQLADGRNADVLGARIVQLVLTVAAVPGVERVRVKVEHGVPIGLFPGFDLRAPVSAADIRRPRDEPPPEPTPPVPPPELATRLLQERLADLGYLDPTGVDGIAGPGTRAAVVAFQKWQGLGRDGVVGPATTAALATATRPTPRVPDGRNHVEVLLDRQLALAVVGGSVVRTFHVSSGAPGFDTPPGDYAVFRKERQSWSVPYSVWLPWATYFVGGIAFHEYPDVPVLAASHGCVRMQAADAEWMYEFAVQGTPVHVIASST